MMGIDPLWKDIIIGVILIVAVYLNSDTKGRDIVVKCCLMEAGEVQCISPAILLNQKRRV